MAPSGACARAASTCLGHNPWVPHPRRSQGWDSTAEESLAFRSIPPMSGRVSNHEWRRQARVPVRPAPVLVTTLGCPILDEVKGGIPLLKSPLLSDQYRRCRGAPATTNGGEAAPAWMANPCGFLFCP